MNINQLRYFISVAEHLNFTRAAETFRMPQSAMSQQIIQMENELDVKLFNRSSKQIQLEYAGIVLLDDARTIVKRYDKALENIKDIQSGRSYSLNISFVGQYERFFLPELITSYREANSDIVTHLTPCSFDNYPRDLELGLTDLVLAFPYEVEGSGLFRIDTLYKDTISLAINKEHPLADVEKLDLKLFENERVFIVNHEEIPRNFERMKYDFHQYRFFPKKIEEVKTFDTMLLMVEAGEGIAFMPSKVQRNALNTIKFYPIEPVDNCFTHEVSVISLKSNQNPCITNFIEHAKTIFSQMDNAPVK